MDGSASRLLCHKLYAGAGGKATPHVVEARSGVQEGK